MKDFDGAQPPPQQSRPASWKGTNPALAVLGVASLLLYGYGLTLEGTGIQYITWFIKLACVQGVLCSVAAWLVWRAPAARRTLWLVVVFAALFRLAVLFAPPLQSDDIYRYIWDGRVQAAGINPYRYIPADPALAHLRDEAIYPRINRRDYAPTIYPPVAQAIFLLVTRVSEKMTWMKVVLVVFEGAGLWALAALLTSFGVPRQRVLLAAWHPLLVWEIANNGHLDALVIFFVALALLARHRERDAATGFLLACATLVKFFPLLLLPALYRRWDWRMPTAFVATGALAYVPYLSVGFTKALGFLSGYAAEEGLESGERFFILSLARQMFGPAAVPDTAYKLFALIVLGALALWIVFRRDARKDKGGFARDAAWLAVAFTVLLSPHYTWYFVWLVPFLCFVRGLSLVPLFCLTVASFVLYGTWLGDKPDDMLRLNSILYLPAAALGFIVWLARRVRRQETI
ncbi:MAG: DUF2029 domain-containing protein [Pyrinomonadaceae bacterium]|nr:DUF2029 domain-containing protein [Pyrinomonadaceae bacterium]